MQLGFKCGKQKFYNLNNRERKVFIKLIMLVVI